MIVKGSFTSTGQAEYVAIPIGATWMKVVNLTTSTTAGAGELADAYWQPTLNYGIGYVWNAGTDATGPAALSAATGFTIYNSGSDNPLGTIDATVTAISNATPPRVTLTATAGMADGDIVRFANMTGGTQLNGMDFTITVIDGTHFDLAYMAPIVAATTGSFYPVKFQDLFYPRARFISEITAGASTVITMTVAHEFIVGAVVRLVVPEAFGMNELNWLPAKVTAISASTITVDIDSTSFTAFAFPLTGIVLTSYAQVLPESQSSVNSGEIGVKLEAGAAAVAGVLNDEISWIAGNDGPEL